MKYLAVAFLCLVSLTAQSPKGAAGTDDTRITLDVTRVNMLFTVSDKKGRFVTDLTKDDFEISEAKKPQTIVEFTAETNRRVPGSSARRIVSTASRWLASSLPR